LAEGALLSLNDKQWRIFTCAQKLSYSQLNLPHGTKQKRLMKKLKIKTEMLRRNGRLSNAIAVSDEYQ